MDRAGFAYNQDMKARALALLLLSGCAAPPAYETEDIDAAPLYAALKADAPDLPPALTSFVHSLEGDLPSAAQALEAFSERLSRFTRATRARRCEWPDWNPVAAPSATLPLRDIQLMSARIHLRFLQGRRAVSVDGLW